MPKHFDVFDRIIDEANLDAAYRQTQRGKSKYKPEAMRFALDETYNLMRLKQSLIDETYEFDGYISFPVYEPKKRIVDAPHYKDKIVQIAINNVLKEIFYPCFIHDSYACIDNKGTHKCVDRIQRFLRKAKWEYGEDAWIIKIDIRKFFYTINRGILKSILPKKIGDKKALRLIYKIVDSATVLSHLGLPLGNTISQICANIYMNKTDQFCKRKLSLRYYARYADDIIVVVKSRDEAKRTLALIKQFLRDTLHLELNTAKTKIFPIQRGVNAIGFKIYPTHRLLRNDSKKRIKRKAKKMCHLITDGKMTVEKAEQMLNSWKGHAEHGSSHNFILSLIKRNDYIYADGKGRLRIDLRKVGGICAN